ncbi:hypothetical protein ES319_D10G261600v1 [Gossypium barbadense]|uniref:Uncharacterized protein n=1 Tax=Gossypium barbadense TaxID=3634 RepID=A0A5J5PVR7_GOSBA|nr:hypothetical protein ES319_D10G261600v1 [Gossypium barbadense]
MINIDFRIHFEIASAIDSYDRILSSLPVVYVGSLPRLKLLGRLSNKTRHQWQFFFFP